MAIENGDQVTIEYVGQLNDGTVFDTSRESVAEESGLNEVQPEREFAPLTVQIGDGEIIEGLEDNLIGLEEIPLKQLLSRQRRDTVSQAMNKS